MTKKPTTSKDAADKVVKNIRRKTRLAAHTSQRYWADTRLEPQVIMRTSSIEAVRSMVANGQGVSILSDMVYQP